VSAEQPVPTRRLRAAAKEAEMSKLHEDFREVANDLRLAAKSMNDLTKTLQPLAEHVPVIVEMAHAWEAGKAVGQTARIAGSFIRWIGGIAFAIAAIWAVYHAKWLALLGNQPN